MDYSLSLPTKEAQDAIKHLHKLMSKIKPKPSYPILDVLVKLDSIELRLVGMSRIIKISSQNIFSFTIPFHDLYFLILSESNQELPLEIDEGIVRSGVRKCNSVHIKLIHPENLTTIDLPLNRTIMDILALRYKYSEDELNQKSYLEMLEKYEANIPNDIETAVRSLSKYGITRKELSKIIDKKIFEHSLK